MSKRKKPEDARDIFDKALDDYSPIGGATAGAALMALAARRNKKIAAKMGVKRDISVAGNAAAGAAGGAAGEYLWRDQTKKGWDFERAYRRRMEEGRRK